MNVLKLCILSTMLLTQPVLAHKAKLFKLAPLKKPAPIVQVQKKEPVKVSPTVSTAVADKKKIIGEYLEKFKILISRGQYKEAAEIQKILKEKYGYYVEMPATKIADEKSMESMRVQAYKSDAVYMEQSKVMLMRAEKRE